jgi:UDPglucose 6-dehydrogenase
MIPRIERAAGGEVRGKTIACLGVTFKPNTDDMRESPSLVILPTLMERGAEVRAYDPQGRANAEPLLPGVEWADGTLEAAEGADLLVILTEWNEFRALNLRALKERMRWHIIVDLRNVICPEVAAEEGFVYYGVGRSDLGFRPHYDAHADEASATKSSAVKVTELTLHQL